MAPATPSPSESRQESSYGLVLFPPGTDPRVKRRRVTFLSFYLLVAAAVVWPIYPLFSAAFPLILGLPLSLAWIVAMLAASFLALLALYLTEEDAEAES